MELTVEPVLFLFMFGVYMQFPAFQELLYVKVCLSQYSSDVCEDLYAPENEDALDWTQNHTSYWSLAATLALSVPAIVVSSLLGSWSDSLGRKLPMALPSCGAAISALVYFFISYLENATVHFILVGCVCTGVCGGFAGCTMATMSYLTDVTSAGRRTSRVMVLESMTFLGGTLGPLVTGFLLPSAGRSTIFGIIALCHILVIVYVAFFLPQVKRNVEEAEAAKGHGMISWYHIRQSLTSCFRPREGERRARLLLYFLSMVIIIIVANGEMDIAYLFLKDSSLGWDSSHFSYFIAAKYGAGTALLIFGGPLSVKMCSATDTGLTQLGLLSRAAGLFLFGASTRDFMVWLVVIVGSGSYLSTPCLRSLISKQVESHELGKVFSCMSMLENVCLLLGSLIFNSLYPAMRETGNSGFTFYIAALMLLLPAAFICYQTQGQLEPQRAIIGKNANDNIHEATT